MNIKFRTVYMSEWGYIRGRYMKTFIFHVILYFLN